MKWFWIALGIFLIGCGTNLKKKSPSHIDQSFSLRMDTSIHQTVLPNGLQILVRQNNYPKNRIYLKLVVNAGSILEDSTQLGVAHFVEHMAFNGTENFPHQEIVNFIERSGMRFGPDLNAYTGFDETVYKLQIPTDSIHLVKKAIQILDEWASRLTFDSLEVEKERGVIEEEWRRGLGAGSRIRNQILPILFDSSRYKERLPIGKMDIIRSCSVQNLKRFYKTWYRPDLMAVLAVGDLPTDSLTQWIAAEFIDNQVTDRSVTRKYFDLPIGKKLKFAKITDPESIAAKLSIYFKFQSDTLNTLNDFKNKLVERVALGLLNQRLYEQSRKANPPFSSAHIFAGRNIRTSDLVYLTMVTSSDQLLKGFEKILQILYISADQGFSDVEINRRKEQILKYARKQYLERDNIESSVLLSELQMHFLRGDYIIAPENGYTITQSLLHQIDTEDIQQVIRNFIDFSRATVIVNGPDKDSLLLPDKQDIVTRVAEISKKSGVLKQDTVTLDSIPVPIQNLSKIIKKDSIPSIDANKYVLSNGITVYAKHTNFKEDEVLLSAFSPGGSSVIPDSLFMSAVVATSIARQSGVGDIDKITLSKKIADKIAVVVPFISNLYEGFNGHSSSEHFQTALKLFHLFVTNPRLDSVALKSYKNRIKIYLENRDNSPLNVFSDSVQFYLSNGHFRTRSWSLDLLAEINLKHVRQVYRDRFSHLNNLQFFIVGNFDKQKIEYWLEKYIGTIPIVANSESWKDRKIRYPDSGITKIIYKGKEQKAITQINLTGKFKWDLTERIKMGLISSILSTQLRNSIREEKSGSYSINVWNEESHFPVSDYRFVIQYASSPDRVDELYGEVLNIIDSLRLNGISEEMLTNVQKARIQLLEKSYQDNDFWLKNMVFKIEHNEPLADIMNYPEIIQNISRQDLNEAFRKYTNATVSTFILMPE